MYAYAYVYVYVYFYVYVYVYTHTLSLSNTRTPEGNNIVAIGRAVAALNGPYQKFSKSAWISYKV